MSKQLHVYLNVTKNTKLISTHVQVSSQWEGLFISTKNRALRIHSLPPTVSQPVEQRELTGRYRSAAQAPPHVSVSSCLLAAAGCVSVVTGSTACCGKPPQDCSGIAVRITVNIYISLSIISLLKFQKILFIYLCIKYPHQCIS